MNYHSSDLKATNHIKAAVIVMNAANYLYTMSLSIYSKANKQCVGDSLV
jgi:hypothetical protein